jgi:hypothetical protein
MKKKTEDRRPKTENRHPVGTTRRVVRPSNIIPPGPRTRVQHLTALMAKRHATHRALITVATGIVNLKRKLRRQEELYRTLAHNYGSRHAEYTRQLVELSNLDCAGLPAEGGAKGDQGLTAPSPVGGLTPTISTNHAASSRGKNKAASSRRTPRNA